MVELEVVAALMLARIICQLKLLPLTIYAGTFSNSRNMPLGPENP